MIISQEVKAIFVAMDDTVNPKLRVKFLQLQVYEGEKYDVAVFHHFLQVLAGYGGGTEEVANVLVRGSKRHQRVSDCILF